MRTKANCSRRACGLTIFCLDFLEDRDVQIPLAKEFFQAVFLKLQGLEPFDVGRLLQAEVRAPGVNGRAADLVLLGGFCRCRAICLMQDRDHLRFRESTLFHGLLFGWEPSSLISMSRRHREGHYLHIRHGLKLTIKLITSTARPVVPKKIPNMVRPIPFAIFSPVESTEGALGPLWNDASEMVGTLR